MGAGLGLDGYHWGAGIRFRFTGDQGIHLFSGGPEIRYRARWGRLSTLGFAALSYASGDVYDWNNQLLISGFGARFGLGLDYTVASFMRLGCRAAAGVIHLYRDGDGSRSADAFWPSVVFAFTFFHEAPAISALRD